VGGDNIKRLRLINHPYYYKDCYLPLQKIIKNMIKWIKKKFNSYLYKKFQDNIRSFGVDYRFSDYERITIFRRREHEERIMREIANGIAQQLLRDGYIDIKKDLMNGRIGVVISGRVTVVKN